MKLIIETKQGLYINWDRTVPFPHKTMLMLNSCNHIVECLLNMFMLKVTENINLYFSRHFSLNCTSSNAFPFTSLAYHFTKLRQLSSVLSRNQGLSATDPNSNDLNPWLLCSLTFLVKYRGTSFHQPQLWIGKSAGSLVGQTWKMVT